MGSFFFLVHMAYEEEVDKAVLHEGTLISGYPIFNFLFWLAQEEIIIIIIFWVNAACEEKVDKLVLDKGTLILGTQFSLFLVGSEERYLPSSAT